MVKKEVKRPFFVFNPKSYLYGEGLLKMAMEADSLAEMYPNITIFVTCPYADIFRVASQTKNILITAQHLDPIIPGRGMGAVLPESLASAGADAVFLNHAEHKMSLNSLVEAIDRSNDLGLITIVCADSTKEARALASLEPDILLCEPTELIGTGQVSDPNYIEETNKVIKKVSPNTLIMQAAGISTAEDVKKIVATGADGTGCTSGIVKADHPIHMLQQMIKALVAEGGE